ncbi:MAG TPA: sulfite exporter TauE/SafE family protein [Vicinamibacterales bacterium]|nr:sulfite exporter TauE/SafE family protein [Vicinamibacterales bacterium]
MNSRVHDALARARVWHAYVAFWLVVWILLVTRPGAWLVALLHWPMALIMIGGSLVAGSTPMGGGTVSFPALVLGFQYSPAMARDFGLAIQSVGMSSALLFILVRRIPVEHRLLTWACVGAAAGLTFGTFALAGRVPADWVKLLFATLWITFGAWLATGAAAQDVAGPSMPAPGREVVPIGIAVGIVGGAVMSLIGVGPEMVVYATLVLRFGWHPKAAVPTAVCATALMAPVGLLLRAVTAGVDPAVFPEWLAAMPIVIFGAPAGAYIAARISRVLLLRIIGALCLIQFAATVAQVRPSPAQWAGIAAMGVVSAVGLWLLAPSGRAVAVASGVTERQV